MTGRSPGSSAPAVSGQRSKWLLHLRQSLLPKPSIGTGKYESAATRSHSWPPGNVQAPSTVPASVRPSTCHRIALPRRMCRARRAARPPGSRSHGYSYRRTSRQDYATPHQISIQSSLTSVTENTATAGWRVRFVGRCGRDCNEAARQFMTQAV